MVRRGEQKKRILEWLDAVYSDLEELSRLWVKIMSDAESVDLDESRQALEILYSRGMNENLHLQRRLVGRLLEFYGSATEVLSGAVGDGRVLPQYKELFIFKLGAILANRLKARGILDQHLSRLVVQDQPIPLSLTVAYERLQEELASLQVLIRNAKARL